MPGVIGIRYPLQWTILKKDRYIDIQSMVFDDLFALRSINQDGTSIEYSKFIRNYKRLI